MDTIVERKVNSWGYQQISKLHLTEGRNTGFKKILNALETNGFPKTVFETDDAHSYFISRLFI